MNEKETSNRPNHPCPLRHLFNIFYHLYGDDEMTKKSKVTAAHQHGPNGGTIDILPTTKRYYI